MIKFLEVGNLLTQNGLRIGFRECIGSHNRIIKRTTGTELLQVEEPLKYTLREKNHKMPTM